MQGYTRPGVGCRLIPSHPVTLLPCNSAAMIQCIWDAEARMQPCKLPTGIFIGPGILPPGQFLNTRKIRVDSDNKRLAPCTKMALSSESYSVVIGQRDSVAN